MDRHRRNESRWVTLYRLCKKIAVLQPQHWDSDRRPKDREEGPRIDYVQGGDPVHGNYQRPD